MDREWEQADHKRRITSYQIKIVRSWAKSLTLERNIRIFIWEIFEGRFGIWLDMMNKRKSSKMVLRLLTWVTGWRVKPLTAIGNVVKQKQWEFDFGCVDCEMPWDLQANIYRRQLENCIWRWGEGQQLEQSMWESRACRSISFCFVLTWLHLCKYLGAVIVY